MSVKAIETVYNGYRFRSRLEARWAVVMDRLGIRYEYEQQGFDLGGTRYLPDFWIPDQETFLEIKPQIGARESYRSVYLAGKISQRCWRHELVPELDHSTHHCAPLEMAIGHLYTGPFFSVFGHGCDHGRSTHGCGDQAPTDRQATVARCLAEIDEADTVFAWIDDPSCYGTLAELGYAKARGKDVFIAFHPSVRPFDDEGSGHMLFLPPSAGKPHDLWFAEELATAAGVFASASEAVECWMTPKIDDDAKLCRLLAEETGCRTLLIRGQPDVNHDDYSISEFKRGGFMAIGRSIGLGTPTRIDCIPRGWTCFATKESLEMGLSAGRQARFEHGQCG